MTEIGGSIFDPVESAAEGEVNSKLYPSDTDRAAKSSPAVTRSKSRGKADGNQENKIPNSQAGKKQKKTPKLSVDKTTQVKRVRNRPKRKNDVRDECNNLTPPPSGASKNQQTSKQQKYEADTDGDSDATMHGINDLQLDCPPTTSEQHNYVSSPLSTRRSCPRSVLSPMPSSRYGENGAPRRITSGSYSEASHSLHDESGSQAGSSVSVFGNTSQGAHTAKDSVGIFIPHSVDAQITVGIRNGVVTVNAAPPSTSAAATEQLLKEERKKTKGKDREKSKKLEKSKKKDDRDRRRKSEGRRRGSDSADKKKARKSEKPYKKKESKRNQTRSSRHYSSEDSSEDSCTCSCSCSSCASYCSTCESTSSDCDCGRCYSSN